MWHIKWLRRLVRRHTTPIHPAKAVDWKQRLSLVYAVIAWNAFGGVCYMLYTGRKDWAKFYGYKSEEDERLSPARQWAQTLQLDKVKVIRVSGLHISSEEEYNAQKQDDADLAINSQVSEHCEIDEKSGI